MSKAETHILHRIMLAIGSRDDARTWRNNVGVAVYPDGSRVRYGLCPGSADLIGFRSVIITPDMVGQKIAVFTAIETKSARGAAEKHQRNFLHVVQEAGGFAGIAKTEQEAEAIISGEAPRI